MPPKKKSVVPKRTIADVEAEYHPQLDAMHTHLEHMRWESNRLESLGEALDMDLNIARERSVRDAGRLEAMREVHVEKKLSDEALQFTINAECQELSGTAFIKERRVGMLKEERDQLRQQLDALKAKSDADSWEQGDINAAQSEIARLVSEVAEAQRRSQRYVRVLDLAKGLEDPCHYGPSSSYFPPTTTTTNTTKLSTTVQGNHGPLQLAVFSATTTSRGRSGAGAPSCPVDKLVGTLVNVCGFARCDQPSPATYATALNTNLLKDLRRVLLSARSNCALVVIVHVFLRRRRQDASTSSPSTTSGLWEASLTDADGDEWVSLDRIILSAMTEGECTQVTLIIEGRASTKARSSSEQGDALAAPLGIMVSKQLFLAGRRDLSVVVEYNKKNTVLEAALYKFIQYSHQQGAEGDAKSYTTSSTPYHGGLIAQVLSHILLHSASASVAANESTLPTLVAQCLRASLSGCSGGMGSMGRLVSTMDRHLSCPPILCLPSPFLRKYLLSGVVGDNGAAQRQHPLEGGLLEMLSATTMGTMPMPSMTYVPIPWSWVSPGRCTPNITSAITDSTSVAAPRSLRLKYALLPAYTDSLAGSRLQCLLAEREELWDHIADRIRQGGGVGGSKGGPPTITVRPITHNKQSAHTTKPSIEFSGSFLDRDILTILIVPISSSTSSSSHPLMAPSSALAHLETMLSTHIDSSGAEDERSPSSVVMLAANGEDSPPASIGETRRQRRIQGLVGDLQERVRRGISFDACALHTETIQTLTEAIRTELAPLLLDQASDWEDDAQDSPVTPSDITGPEMQRLVQVETVHSSGVDPTDGLQVRVDVSAFDPAKRAHLAASLHHYALVELQASPPLFLVSNIHISTTPLNLCRGSNTTLSVLEDALPSILTYAV